MDALQAVVSQSSDIVPSVSAVQSLLQEARWTLRQDVEVSSVAVHAYRKKLQVYQDKHIFCEHSRIKCLIFFSKILIHVKVLLIIPLSKCHVNLVLLK